jgi:tetratricopeptide (TPR) repeat protein
MINKNRQYIGSLAIYSVILIIVSFFISFFSAIPAEAQQSSEPAASSVYPVSVCDPAVLIDEARNFYRQKDYISAINRIETIMYINRGLSPELNEMLTEALAGQLENELAKSDYRNAASYNLKIMALRENFDFAWLNKLLNIYMLSANYRKTHELCLEILKKQGLLALDERALSKIYGKLSVVYATFRDSARSFDSLIEAALKDNDFKAIKSYTALIFPAHLNAGLLLDHAAALAGKNKLKEAYIAAVIYRRTAEKPDAKADELIDALIKKEPSLKDAFVSMPASPNQAGSSSGSAYEVAAVKNNPWQNETDTSMVVLSNVPAKLKTDGAIRKGGPNTPSKQSGSEIEMTLLRAGELFERGKYEDAIAEYEKAKSMAGDDLKKEIDKKIFSAYWHSKEDYIKFAAYSIILIIIIILFYYFNPMSFFNKEQYSLISVSKTLKKGVDSLKDKKYQQAINELEKLVDMKLSTTETVALFLNLGIAYYYINSYAGSLMALKKVLQYDYENIDAYKYLARIYIKTKDRSFKAIEVFNFLISKKMADLEMLKAVLNHNVSQNSIDEAGVQIASDILSVDIANETAGRYIVKYFSKIKRFDDEALRFVEKYMEACPRDVDSRIILLETYYRRKDYKKVISECGVLFTYACDNILIHSIFIDSIVNLNKPQMLISEYDRLSRENPGSIITNFINQSLRSLIIDKKSAPQVDYALAVRINFNVCHKCFHLNLNEFNNCQRCGSALKI